HFNMNMRWRGVVRVNFHGNSVPLWEWAQNTARARRTYDDGDRNTFWHSPINQEIRRQLWAQWQQHRAPKPTHVCTAHKPPYPTSSFDEAIEITISRSLVSHPRFKCSDIRGINVGDLPVCVRVCHRFFVGGCNPIVKVRMIN